jgi:glycerol-3-phosphate dehydrogenase
MNRDRMAPRLLDIANRRVVIGMFKSQTTLELNIEVANMTKVDMAWLQVRQTRRRRYFGQ